MGFCTRSFVLASLVASSLGVADAQGGGEPPPPITRDQMLEALKDALPFEVHGGVLLWYYEPFIDGAEDHTEIYYANLTLDAAYEDFGFHFEPRFRDTKLRPFFESNVWVQEMYLSWQPCGEEGGVLKTGKLYSQFGRFWDGSFYGNIPYFDGTKLDPDLGVSWEDQFALGEAKVDYSLQYFTQDGVTNGSLQGRDTLSIMARQRDILVGRVAPTLPLGTNSSLTLGVSAMSFEADLPGPVENSDVTRTGGEASLNVGALTVFGDFSHQNGNHVVDFPLPGSTSDDIDYLMTGVSYQIADWTLRYNYSSADYSDDDVMEDLHLPGVVYQINEHVSAWLEYVYWNRDDDGDDEIQDRSLNVILYGSF